MPTKTDPATNLPLTDAEVATAWDATMGAVTGRDAYFNWLFLPEPDRFRALAFARAAYALAASRVDTAEVERRAASKAWDVVVEMVRVSRLFEVDVCGPAGPSIGNRLLGELRRERVPYLAREYPAPAPRECVLSDGSVVIVERQFERFNRGNGTRYAGLHFWREILDDSDTGADFDALKRFAAEVGQ